MAADRHSSSGATFKAATLHRRRLLEGALYGSAALAVGLRAPAVLGQSKKFAGVTLNGCMLPTCLSDVHQGLHPRVRGSERHEGQSRPSGFPGLQPAHGSRALDQGLGLRLLQHHLHLYGSLDRRRLDGAARSLHQRSQHDAAPTGTRRISSAARRARSSTAKGATYGFAWEAGAMIMAAARGDLHRQGRPQDADHLRRADAGLQGDAPQGGRRSLRQRQAAPLGVDPVPHGLWRHGLPRSAGRPDARPSTRRRPPRQPTTTRPFSRNTLPRACSPTPTTRRCAPSWRGAPTSARRRSAG